MHLEQMTLTGQKADVPHQTQNTLKFVGSSEPFRLPDDFSIIRYIVHFEVMCNTDRCHGSRAERRKANRAEELAGDKRQGPVQAPKLDSPKGSVRHVLDEDSLRRKWHKRHAGIARPMSRKVSHKM